ncbi:MAG TPA: SpvB/TcaC N-terminal domain-containing protein, partial [Bryobacteraceae bacterium]
MSLPKGGGAIRGIGEKFAANPVTGAGSLTVPIYTSPGRSGFGPQLSLSYNSGSGNGPFGFGWSIGLPAVTRKTDKGLPQYEDARESDIFILSGAEDLMPSLVDGSGQWTRDVAPSRSVYGQQYAIHRYRPRVEGLFARIERWINLSTPQDTFWRSISKDNITTWYGKTPESRIADPADPSRVFSWLICQSYDDRGNVIAYEYKPEDSTAVDLRQINERNRTDTTRPANRYLKHIFYGNRTPYFPDNGTPYLPDLTGTAELPLPTDWCFELVFDYGEHDLLNPVPQDTGMPWNCRLDPFSAYRPTFEVRTYRLCRRALMFHHFPAETNVGPDCLVRSTDLEYSVPLADPSQPFYSYLVSAMQTGYTVNSAGGYFSKSLPPLEFSYTAATVDETVRDVDPESLKNLPCGLDGANYRWADLDGEGLSGILTEQAGSWFYKANLSPVNRENIDGAWYTLPRFAPVELVARQPSLAALSRRRPQLLDLSGDGHLDLVDFEGSTPGYFERTEDANWDPFVSFGSLPVLDWSNPELKFVDLTGDGFPDLLISEGDAFRWYKSLVTLGFAEGHRLPQSLDEEQGPKVIFSDSTESIFLADLSGDGLTDLVRVRNGEVCYWPNLGYGHFGAKVAMDHAPLFEGPNLFDGRRIRLADIDGSGTVDIVYFASGSVQLYFNQSGNGWGAARVLNDFPSVESVSSATVLDLLGNGTACLVWSSALAGSSSRPMRYIDLMGGQKPHLLVRVINNLGAETAVQYAPSTKFYVADKLEGTPWVTRIPFPVHVVERVRSYDYVSRNLFVTRYAYHHGYYDGVEREFRGFGRVDQWDTEEFATLANSTGFPQPTNVDAASNVSPVLTKTWFHTGAYFGETRISRYFDEEYYSEGDSSDVIAGLTPAQLEAMRLDDTVLPVSILLPDGTRIPCDLSPEESREACRALRGSILRQEIYAIDGTDAADRPYFASERNYTIEVLQPQGPNPYGVFFSHVRESINFQYERKLFKVSGDMLADPMELPPVSYAADPRVSHSLTLAVDPFGNVLESATVGYRRRYRDPALTPADQMKQCATLSTYTETTYTNAVLLDDVYRTPLPAQSTSYQLLQVKPAAAESDITNLFGFDELAGKIAAAGDGAHDVAYENLTPAGLNAGQPYRRLLKSSRTLYRPDDMGASAGDAAALLPLGSLESLALAGDSYTLAFTAGLVSQIYQRAGTALLPDPASVFGSVAPDGGGYVDPDGNGNWWVPSGRIYYLPSTASSQDEQIQAIQHFFLPRRIEDPFGNATTVDYDDPHDLLPAATTDASLNTVTAVNDYRVLKPSLLTDANGNRGAVSFDILGLVAGTAVMGKATETLGDSLTGFMPDLTQQQIDDFYSASDPHTLAAALLGTATTRIVYDVDRFQNSQAAAPADPTQWQPAFSAALTRETHVSDLVLNQETKIPISFSFSDGFSRESQKKVQAEPGPVVAQGPTVDPRWVGSGWTILNNKGKPVRQYEPFFSQLTLGHQFEFGVTIGVSPILCYDPLTRVIATVHPNQTYDKVVFDPWRQDTWDVNDTVLETDPTADADVGELLSRLPSADYTPTWYSRRAVGGLGPQELDAANKAAAHANTPGTAYFDSLGRPFLTIADNAAAGNYQARVELDIEGKQRSVTDALGRTVMVYDYDVPGNRIHQASMEAAERWMLNDVTGKPIRFWDTRGHNFRTSYDVLRRLTGSYVLGTDAVNSDPRTLAGEILFEQTIYGEGQQNDTAQNLRTRVFQHFDNTGIATSSGLNPATNLNEGYDFKGNLLRGARQLVQDYKSLADWSGTPPVLQTQVFASSTQYDALNRAIAHVSPDGSVFVPTYNDASLLETIDVNLQGAQPAKSFVTNIDYNARAQREQIQYGNGASTAYEYDPATFRLTRLTTRRADSPTDVQTLQDLLYTFDPVGNVTHIQDAAQDTIFFSNKLVEPDNDYTYDAIYRLIAASGREQLGQSSGGGILAPTPASYNDSPRIQLLQPGDSNAMGTYTEQYLYDAAGNFLQYIHKGTDAASPGWSRSYTYSEASLLETGNVSNRLTLTTVSGAQPYIENYAYDLHGNMLDMPQLQIMQWDFKDQLTVTQRQAVNAGDTDGTVHQGERTYYVYDSTGQRVRKVTERQNGTLMKERLYLGGYEVYREYDASGSTVTLERDSLNVMDGKRRIALVETQTSGDGGAVSQVIRYQFANHLGSASLELDDEGQIISYEEYYPYGSTSYQAGVSIAEVSLKRYRYTGMERDEETGLQYHSARYFAPWLGRWTICDSVQTVNLYSYCECNPVTHSDVNGKEPDDSTPEAAAAPPPANPPANASPPTLPADVGPYRKVGGDHIHQVASRTGGPGAKRTTASQFRAALSKSTKDPTYGDRAGQQTERSINRAAYGQDYDGPITPSGAGAVTLRAEGNTAVGRSKPATPSSWFEDLKSFYKLRAAGTPEDVAGRMVFASSRQLASAGATPTRVPYGPNSVPRNLKQGQ